MKIDDENENEKDLNVYDLKIYVVLKVFAEEESQKKSFKIFD